jgi:hypothetical protein
MVSCYSELFLGSILVTRPAPYRVVTNPGSDCCFLSSMRTKSLVLLRLFLPTFGTTSISLDKWMIPVILRTLNHQSRIAIVLFLRGGSRPQLLNEARPQEA